MAGSSEQTDQEPDSGRRNLRERKVKTKVEQNGKSITKFKMAPGKSRKSNERLELEPGLFKDVSLSPCSLQSGPIAGRLKSRSGMIEKVVHGRKDLSSSTSSFESGLKFDGTRKKTQKPRRCTICGESFIRLERHILLVHKSKQSIKSSAVNGDVRIYFSIATKELSEVGEAIEDLQCGMKPETTLKQIKKSYCKRFGWKLNKSRLQLGGKYLWEGQTVAGFEGVTILAVKMD